MHYPIIIITDENISSSLLQNYFLKNDYLVISDFTNLDNYSLFLKEKEITFDYLVFSKPINDSDIVVEGSKYVTNNYFETSKDNYFACGSIVNSNKPFINQLKIIFEFIKNPL